jgi:hypothetical protein
MCQAANVVCHYRASHPLLTGVVLVHLALLITSASGLATLIPTLERPKSPLIDTLHQEQLPGKDA